MDGMERAHSHRTTTTTGGGEFFICFTARLSSSASSAARIPSSKSLMSPGRPAAPSLSASLSRRLRSSGSIKGTQSPMFPPSSRRSKGAAFEPAEPSSPKVSCIGQVRVKSKKKMKDTTNNGVPVPPRSRSQREASFRRERECLPPPQQQRNHQHHQSWVYQLPLSICEALRSIGSEVNCFAPCRSPCSGKAVTSSAKRSRTATSSCGAVFARWLMAIEEERDEEEEVKDVGFLREATAVEILGMEEIAEVRLPEKKEELLVVMEEEGRVSVCVPPRNALLLMRCRSDPVRVAALADRFWGSPAAAKFPCQEKCGANEEEDDKGPDQDLEDIADEIEAMVCSENVEEAEEEERNADEIEVAGNPALDGVVSCAVEVEEETNVTKEVVMNEEDDCPPLRDETGISEEGLLADTLQVEIIPSIELKDSSHCDGKEVGDTACKGRRSTGCSKLKEGGRRRSFSVRDKERRRHSFSSERRHSFSSEEKEARRGASFSIDKEGRSRWSFCLEKEELTPKIEKASSSLTVAAESNTIMEEVIPSVVAARESVEDAANKPSSITEETQTYVASVAGDEGKEGRTVVEEKRRELPDCLLQMMYEPKLSMEVSKETWVCSTDFLRWRPHHPQRPSAKGMINPVGDNPLGCNEDSECNKGKTMMPAAEVPVQPPTPPPQLHIPPLTPPAPPIASAIEHKCTNSSAAVVTPPSYGPLVLTRCNSEPVRSSATLVPDACFWKSQHRPIGAAGIGF